MNVQKGETPARVALLSQLCCEPDGAESFMDATEKSIRLTSGERLTAVMLRRAPWLAFFIIALPAPLFFLWRYLTATEEIAVWLLFVLASLGVSSLMALGVVVLLVLYRRRWEKRLRERLATDGITADELVWFQKDLTKAERSALKEMEQQNPLLADAYRETLAARLTASHVLNSAQREMLTVERRLEQINAFQSSARAASPADATANRSELQAALNADRARLERISKEAREHQSEVETRLQMIEAAARRKLSESETELALLRLNMTREHEPYALHAARGEQKAREDIERMLRASEAKDKSK
ncbi:MAG TPA: hypothetical protein VNA19_09460 [Pyrinomonadaceae bacterium]|nr:hypothetical protein [Pyrinomonadaceae bacterium]